LNMKNIQMKMENMHPMVFEALGQKLYKKNFVYFRCKN
jgi:hypothetical protein